MAKSQFISLLHTASAIALAIVLLFVGASAADTYHLPLIHSWALMHGAIFVIFPIYFLLFYFLLRPIARRLQPPPDTIAPQHVSFLAVASLPLSGFGFFIPMVGSILGIVCGHVARRRCKANPQLFGSGIALGGLILGYLGLVFSAYMIVAVLFGVMGHHGS